MSDPQGTRWRAIFAGLLLLVGADVLGGAQSLAARAHEWSGASAAESEAAVKRGLIAALSAKAPRVDPMLSARIADSIARCEREQALAPDLVLAVLMQESSGRPGARSPAGAIGLMQVMPYMYEELALPGSVSHVEANIEAGCRLLADNIRRLGEEEGISAYCWGNVVGNDRYLRRVQKLRRDIRPYLPPDGSTPQIRG